MYKLFLTLLPDVQTILSPRPCRQGREEGQAADWGRFAHILGHKELARLDARGVAYHLPPPGAKCKSVLNVLAYFISLD